MTGTELRPEQARSMAIALLLAAEATDPQDTAPIVFDDTDAAWRVTFHRLARADRSPIVGTCPACGEDVRATEPDGPVWTCPADLSESNPYREAPDERITEELREATGVYSNCGDDYGFGCYDPMPLHSACYDRGNY